MKNILVFIISIFLLVSFSCENDTKSSVSSGLLTEIQNGNSQLNRDSLKTLKTKVDAFLSNSTETEKNAELMYEYGLLLDKNRSFGECVDYMKKLVLKYPESKYSDEALFTLANIYKLKLRDNETSATISKILSNKNPEFEKIEEVKSNIPGTYLGVDHALDTLEKRSLVTVGDVMKIDRQNAESYIFLSQLNAKLGGKSKSALKHLDKSGEFARSVGKNEELLDILNLIISDYPESDEGQESYFLKAFHYENVLNDKETAKTLYTEFMEKFPNNIFAKDAKFLLDNIDKTEEEILKEFEEKTKN